MQVSSSGPVHKIAVLLRFINASRIARATTIPTHVRRVRLCTAAPIIIIHFIGMKAIVLAYLSKVVTFLVHYSKYRDETAAAGRSFLSLVCRQCNQFSIIDSLVSEIHKIMDIIRISWSWLRIDLCILLSDNDGS